MSNSKSLKLLFYVTEDWYFVSHRLELAVAAQAEGYDVVIVTRVRNNGKHIIDAGLRLVNFENSRTSMNIFLELFTLLRLIKLYRQERPDILHHVAIKPVLYGSIAAMFLNSPHIVNAIAGMGWLKPSLKGFNFLKSIIRWGIGKILKSGIGLVQNPDDARQLAGMGLSIDKIKIIQGAGVDLNTYFPHDEIDGIPVVVLPARLLWAKGVREFVEMSKIFIEKGIKAKFILAGIPDSKNPQAVPMRQINQWVANNWITYLGWVDNMQQVLSESHIVCLPSYYGEGIPKSLIEAAAAGRPIVTTDTPGCREIVHHGINGLLVPPRDVSALSSAIESLIMDGELRRSMGLCGRKRAELEFGLDKIIPQTLELYKF
jgi:glycosyltransferase involved in cell wall biosynthesis